MYVAPNKILVLIAGGVFRGKHVLHALENKTEILHWCSDIHELALIADVHFEYCFGGHGNQLAFDIGKTVSQKIASVYDMYDGFVIVSGMDSLEYLAASFSYAFEKLGKPIVFTAAGLERRAYVDPLTDDYFGELGLRANIINAVHVGTLDIGEVVMVFGSRVYHAARGMREERSLLGDLHSERDMPSLRKRVSGNPEIAWHFDDAVYYLRPYPEPPLGKEMMRFFSGFFINGAPHGLISKNFEERLRAAKLPIALHTEHSLEAQSDDSMILMSGVSEPSAAVKFSWVLGDTRDPKRIRDMMLSNVRGEYHS